MYSFGVPRNKGFLLADPFEKDIKKLGRAVVGCVLAILYY